MQSAEAHPSTDKAATRIAKRAPCKIKKAKKAKVHDTTTSAKTAPAEPALQNQQPTEPEIKPKVKRISKKLKALTEIKKRRSKKKKDKEERTLIAKSQNSIIIPKATLLKLANHGMVTKCRARKRLTQKAKSLLMTGTDNYMHRLLLRANMFLLNSGRSTLCPSDLECAIAVVEDPSLR
jgi:hypothetical protein